MSNVVPLRYVARAGLLPELTRQTYDSLYKALREAILNGVDAGAGRIVVDLSRVTSDGTLTVSDDGGGMSLRELQGSFLSLGGSNKFESSGKFGRIGIGSLALMHYAQRVEIESKKAGQRSVTKAVISHPWALNQTQRAQALGEFSAGEAWSENTTASLDDSFTVIRLHGVDSVLVSECGDIGSFYKLIERLRRILPLPWEETEVARQLESVDPGLVALIRSHAEIFMANVVIRSPWADDEGLTRRVYGDGGAQDEAWNGQPHPILKDVVVEEEGKTPRTVRLAGYLLSQVRPSAEWSGLTARVQNVAVEEGTFFDLSSDPGFRKYITGEIWILDGVDRTRLINIDRASFSRESSDYRVIARAMRAEIVRFKADCVQAPQRAKVAIKRRLDQQAALLEAATNLGAAISGFANGSAPRGFPSSKNGAIRAIATRGLVEDLQGLGAVVVVRPSSGRSRRPYDLRIAGDGRHVLAEVDAVLAQPEILLAGKPYLLRLVEGRSSDPPIIVKNRPREIVLNLAHDAFSGQLRQTSLEMVMALELAYLSGATRDEDIYGRVLGLISTLG